MRHLSLSSGIAVFILLTSFAAVAQPSGFQQTVVWSNLSTPVAIRFAPDGRAFVIEKWGVIKAFDSITDTIPTTVGTIGSQLWTFHDHGLLGLEVDPQFPTRPYIYVMYAMRGVPGARVSRFTINPATNLITGSEVVLLEGWAFVYPSHGVGDLRFGPEGALYVSSGDAASFNIVDWGQDEPYNPDASPLGPIDAPDPPLEGGALRSQDIRSTADPLGFNGSILRINPDTGAAWAGNPLAGGDASDDRFIGYGLRNPFRFTVHPTNNSVWICDVGWNNWEELNRIPFPFAAPVPNFGWPAYEGVGRLGAYEFSNLPLVNTLYTENSATAPFYTYQHIGGASITGAAFYTSGDYPAQYQGALFIADYTQQWIKVMFPDINGTPNPNTLQTFVTTGANAIDLEIGPGGDLYYVDIVTNQVRRIDYLLGNNPPVAVIQASATSGASPLQVNFSASGSSDPDAGSTLTYSWDLNGDGVFGDSTAVNPSHTYVNPGNYLVQLRVTDNNNASDTDSVTISIDNLPPVPEILTPTVGSTWQVGDLVSFTGRATDPETGLLPAAQLTWQIVLLHCANTEFTDCHEHHVTDVNGQASGNFIAIDHEYPCYIEIRLTATEPGLNGLSATSTLSFMPQLTTLTLQSDPVGFQVGMFSQTQIAPLVRDVIVNGQTTVTAVSPQTVSGQEYEFTSWSDAGGQTHSVTVGESPQTLTAFFAAKTTGDNAPPVLDPIWDKYFTEGNYIEFWVHATDPDGDPVTLSANNLPAGSTFTDQGGGWARFVWPESVNVAGDYTMSVTARDNHVPQGVDTRSFWVHVFGGNQPPASDAVWPQQITAGSTLSFVVNGWDTDGDIPDLYAENLPAGATFVDNGWGVGTFNWPTTASDTGVYTGLKIVVTDHGTPPLSKINTFTIRVNGNANAPGIDPIPSVSSVAGDPINLSVYSFDPNGTIPVLTAQNLPSGAVFDTNGNGTGTFSWTPTQSDVGVHFGIVILATDSVTPALTFKAYFNIEVIAGEGGEAPVLDPIGDKTAHEGELLEFVVSATDADGPAIVLNTSTLPAGAAFVDHGDGTGTFSWTPLAGASTNSPYAMTFEASDGELVDNETISITVDHPNQPPHLETIGNKSAVEGSQLQFSISAHDHDGEIPTLSATGLPAGAGFVDNGDGTGVFTWTPAAGASSNSPYSATFTASDGELEHSETISIAVTITNLPPVVAAGGPFTFAEAQVWSTNVTASDPNGTVPSLSATNLPAGATFADNGNGSGTIAWTPDYSASVGSPYSVTVTANDGTLSGNRVFTLNVTNTNRTPQITPITSKNVNENQLLSFTVTATDPDGTTPTLSAQTLPLGATFVNNGNGTGSFNWTPDYAAAAGSPYTVTFVASDGTASANAPVSITVNNVNRAPQITPITSKNVNENVLLSFTVTATDPDGTTPTLSAQTLPSGATFVNNGNGTGSFNWTPSYAAAAGSPYTVTFVASDGTASANAPVSITVNNVNRAPQITPITSKNVNENVLLSFTVTATDPDGTTPTLSAQTLPSGATFVNNGNGTGSFNWTPSYTAAAGSPYTVTFVASDGVASANAPVTITVNNVNRAPTIAPIGNKVATIGQLLTFTVTATDPDGTTPTLSAQNLPSTATFTPGANGTGTFSWTPNSGAANGSPYSVTFNATDGQLTGSQTITITIGSNNNAPVLDAIWDKHFTQGNYLEFWVRATDSNGDTIALTATGVPAGASFTDRGGGWGQFVWAAQSNVAGTYPMSVTATDNRVPPLSHTRNFTVFVLGGNQAPQTDPVWPVQITAGGTVSFSINAWDTDGDVPSLSAQNLPPGAQFVDHGFGYGTFNWTTTAAHIGVWSNIRIIATDHGSPQMSKVNTFSITVTAP